MNSTIIIIDDEISYRRKLRLLLEKEEYSIIAMCGNDEIFTALDEGDISLMIIDPHLQDVDGFELIRQAREISPNTEINILTKEGTMETAPAPFRPIAQDVKEVHPPSGPHARSNPPLRS